MHGHTDTGAFTIAESNGHARAYTYANANPFAEAVAVAGGYANTNALGDRDTAGGNAICERLAVAQPGL